MKIDYHGRKFAGISNAAHGQVSSDTVFQYYQNEHILTAIYSRGSIHIGYMLGLVLEDNSLQFVYHHIDIDGNIRSGHCNSIPEILPDGRIRLHETWEWTFGGEGHGESIVEEI